MRSQANYLGALECYNRAITLNAKNKKCWYNKGNILADQGSLDKALECYDRALEIDANFVVALKSKKRILSLKKQHGAYVTTLEFYFQKNKL